MEKNFKRLKTVYRIRTALLSAALGVSAGLLAVGIVLLSLKLNEIIINAGFYVLIGLAVAALTGTGLFFIMRPDDAAVAKKLDDGYSLGEKIQTMVAYRAEEGDLIALQREDALGRLSGLKAKAPPLKKILFAAAAALVGIAMFVTSVVVPARVTIADDNPDDKFAVSSVQLVALRQLIDDVEISALAEQPKTSVVNVLEGLYDVIDDITLESVMRTTVVSAVTAIDGIMAEQNSYVKISGELSLTQNEHLVSVAQAILTGVTAYRTQNARITTLSRVNEIALTHDAVIENALSESLTPLRDEWAELVGTTLAGRIESFYETFSTCLEGSEYNSDDGLYSTLYSLSEDLIGVAQKIRGGGHNSDAIQTYIREACEKFSFDASVVLGDQTYVCMMDEFVRNRLADIFEIRIADLPSNEIVNPITPVVPDPGEQEPDDGTHGGGGGDQDVVLGSNDMVYSPADDAHVKYATVINAYYAEVLERIQKGEADEELAESLRKYFEILFSGIEDSEDNEN